MDDQSLDSLSSIIHHDLYSKKIVKTYNSIGSNIFFEFADDSSIHPTDPDSKPWTIWVENSAWRITKNETFLSGSGDEKIMIQVTLDQLMGRRIIALSFVSQFLDLMIEFEGGYKLNTFICWNSEGQWTIFTPKGTFFSVETAKSEEIALIQAIANELVKLPTYTELPSYLYKSKIKNAHFNEWDELEIILVNDHVLCFDGSVWRLERDDQYLVGFLDVLDDVDFEPFFQELVGKEIKMIQIQENLMDSTICIGDDYFLRTFSRTSEERSWFIHNKLNILFELKINNE